MHYRLAKNVFRIEDKSLLAYSYRKYEFKQGIVIA